MEFKAQPLTILVVPRPTPDTSPQVWMCGEHTLKPTDNFFRPADTAVDISPYHPVVRATATCRSRGYIVQAITALGPYLADDIPGDPEYELVKEDLTKAIQQASAMLASSRSEPAKPTDEDIASAASQLKSAASSLTARAQDVERQMRGSNSGLADRSADLPRPQP